MRLMQQIADTLIVGRDSSSQESDGPVARRLRSVLISLLDAMAESHPGVIWMGREAGEAPLLIINILVHML